MDAAALTMTVACAIWNNRIAPMFDVSRRALVVRIELGQVVSTKPVALETELPAHKVLRLLDAGVEVLVCGGISRDLTATIEAYGIHVYSSVIGDIPDVLRALMAGELRRCAFAPPEKARTRGARNMAKRRRVRCRKFPHLNE